MYTNKLTGKLGESIATDFLKKKGWMILAINEMPIRWGEIDLIALDRTTLVFVEVKTRSSKSFGNPDDFITYRKKNALYRSAQAYLQKDGMVYSGLPMRFDYVGVNLNPLNNNVESIEHLGIDL